MRRWMVLVSSEWKGEWIVIGKRSTMPCSPQMASSLASSKPIQRFDQGAFIPPPPPPPPPPETPPPPWLMLHAVDMSRRRDICIGRRAPHTGCLSDAWRCRGVRCGRQVSPKHSRKHDDHAPLPGLRHGPGHPASIRRARAIADDGASGVGADKIRETVTGTKRHQRRRRIDNPALRKGVSGV